MRCVACDIEDWREGFNRLNTDFVKCGNCGLVRMKTIPSPEQIFDHYAEKFARGNYELIQKYDDEYKAIYKHLLEFTMLYSGNPRGKRLIDIGCFTGRFLDMAQEAGFSTYGVELQPEAARVANRRHGGRVYCGPIEHYSSQSSGSFDVATLFGVIEHVTEPNTTVRITAELLKPSGIFVIQTPNTASVLARLLGKRWPAYAPIEHIYYFSPRNIKMLLKKNGLRIIKLARHWKKLPVSYVYSQFQNFGPEYHRFISKLMPIMPKDILQWKLPFYGGEMLLIGVKG